MKEEFDVQEVDKYRSASYWSGLILGNGMGMILGLMMLSVASKSSIGVLGIVLVFISVAVMNFFVLSTEIHQEIKAIRESRRNSNLNYNGGDSHEY